MFLEYADTGEKELYDLNFDPYQLESKPQAGNEQLYSTLQTRLDALRACSREGCRSAEGFADTASPRVTSTIPTAGAPAVAPSSNLKATFSEEMMASSINGQSFKLFEQGSTTRIAATVRYEASTDTATLDPANSLRKGNSYKAVISTGAKDAAGNPLDQNIATTGLQQKTWLFTVSP